VSNKHNKKHSDDNCILCDHLSIVNAKILDNRTIRQNTHAFGRMPPGRGFLAISPD